MHSSAMLRRRALLASGLTTAFGLSLPFSQARAQAFPAGKPIRLIVGFAAGGPTDALARVIAPELGAVLGQQLVVDNRGGAGGLIGMDMLQTSAPDGYNLGMLAVTSVIANALAGKAYDAGKVSPISLVYDQYMVLLVNPAFAGMENIHTLKDLLAYAKANQGKLNYTSAGNGSMGHMTMEAINSAAGVKMTHVGYRGTAPAINDLLAGQLGVMFGDSVSSAPHIKAGKLRPVVVSYPERVPGLPQVATVAEQGFPSVAGVAWVALAGPPGMPAGLVSTINAALRTAYAKPEVASRIRALNAMPRTSTPEASRDLINHDFAFWRKVVVDNNIKGE